MNRSQDFLWGILLISLVLGASVQFLPAESMAQNSLSRQKTVRFSQVSKDTIQLINISERSIDVSGLWVHNGLLGRRLGDLQSICGEIVIPGGSDVTLVLDFMLYLEVGELALYSDDQYSPEQMQDYVNWGFSNFRSENLNKAEENQYWQAEESLPPLLNGESLIWDQEGRFASSWSKGRQQFCPQPIEDCSSLNGGVLRGNDIEICIGNGAGHLLSSENFILVNEEGAFKSWALLNADGIILRLSPDILNVDLEKLGPGVFTMVHMVFTNEVDDRLLGTPLNEVPGCVAISNPITITIRQSSSAGLRQLPLKYCVDDGIRDTIRPQELFIDQVNRPRYRWAVTNERNVVIAYPDKIGKINFENSGAGRLLLWAITNPDKQSRSTLASNLFNSHSCTDVAGPIAIERYIKEDCLQLCRVEAGSISTLDGATSVEFCGNDDIPDKLSIDITPGNDTSTMVVTDNQGLIFSVLKKSIIDFSNAEPGQYFVYNVAFIPEVVSVVPGMNLFNLGDCTDLSDPVTVAVLPCSFECDQPVNLTSNKTSNQVNIRWNEVERAQKYHVSISSRIDTAFALTFETPNPRISFSSLEGGPFLFEVRAECGPDDMSPFSEQISVGGAN